VHWAGFPFAAARFPPPSVTPATASMPRSPFRDARFRVTVVATLSTSMPSSRASTAMFRASNVSAAVDSTSSPSIAGPRMRLRLIVFPTVGGPPNCSNAAVRMPAWW
jgi:hypothetical protein